MTRPRGFVPWRPHKRSAAVLEQVQAVLEEYADYLPMTLRQVFYRLAVEVEESERRQLIERVVALGASDE